MKNKIIRRVFFAVIFFFPALALAQWDPSSYTETKLPSNSVYNIIHNLLLWILGIFSAIAIIGFVVSGILYLVSTGEKESVEKAKKAMTMSIVGVIVALMGLVILQAVNKMLTGTDPQF